MCFGNKAKKGVEYTVDVLHQVYAYFMPLSLGGYSEHSSCSITKGVSSKRTWFFTHGTHFAFERFTIPTAQGGIVDERVQQTLFLIDVFSE